MRCCAGMQEALEGAMKLMALVQSYSAVQV